MNFKKALAWTVAAFVAALIAFPPDTTGQNRPLDGRPTPVLDVALSLVGQD